MISHLMKQPANLGVEIPHLTRLSKLLDEAHYSLAHSWALALALGRRGGLALATGKQLGIGRLDGAQVNPCHLINGINRCR